MIGDWVLVKGVPTIVYDVQESGINIEFRPFDAWVYDSETSEEDISPIPLTPEILEKNGFEPIENKVVDEAYIFDRNEFEEPDIIIRRFDFNDSFVLCTVMDNTAIISIAYVHQLQHALLLCGIEKEIVL